jgi:2-methylisocitrate lyase-like PEP mutase family enzyme
MSTDGSITGRVRVRSLRQLLAAPDLIVVVECYSALTARIVELEGFPATYIGGQAIGALFSAVPDYGLISSHELVAHTSQIAASISIPLIVDADQGGETTLNVRRAIRDFEHAGAAGAHLEDTINPKHVDGDRLITVDQMRARISAAIDARRTDEFIVIARTDLMLNGGTIDETIERGLAYAAEGADVLMVLGVRDVESLRSITREVGIPVLDINRRTSFARESGLKIDLFGGMGLPTAVLAHIDLVQEIKSTGAVDFKKRHLDPEYFAELIDDRVYKALAESWASAQP